jgi:hypothetical protein
MLQPKYDYMESDQGLQPLLAFSCRAAPIRKQPVTILLAIALPLGDNGICFYLTQRRRLMLSVEIDVKDFLIGLLIIAVIVLVIFAIVAIYRLGKSMIKLDKILTDFEVVSEIASVRTKQFDGAIDGLSKTVSGASKKIQGGQNVITVISILVSMFATIRHALQKDDGNTKKEETADVKAGRNGKHK